MANTGLDHLWQHTLAEWAASGLSGAAFCREHGLGYHQFSYWRRKLRAEGQSDAGAGFARVAPTVAATETADALTVSLPGGVSITGLHAGNVELLAAVLRQL